MAKKTNIGITPHKYGWAVKRVGSKMSSMATATKEQTEKIGRDLGEIFRVEVINQWKNGTIQSKDSCGDDPNPPKDTEN